MAPQPDLTEFLKLSNPRVKTCAVEGALEALTGAARKQFEAAMATDPGVITNQAISYWLAARDLAVKWQSISTHRRGTCSCG